MHRQCIFDLHNPPILWRRDSVIVNFSLAQAPPHRLPFTMFVPFFSPVSSKRRSVFRRKGGGGGGRGGGGGKGGSSGKGSSGSGGSSSGSKGAGKSSPVKSGGTSKSATSYGSGGGKASTIPSGQLFAGRTSGGATRSNVFGSSTYGSGYPGIAGQGVAGRGFPFVFWPLAWGAIAGAGTSSYLHTTEYGSPDNTSRPGGVMMTAAFSSTSQNTTFRIVADNTTVVSLIGSIATNCSSTVANASSVTPTTYNDSVTGPTKPEQAIEYYRASSVALTLDGYNNTGALGPEGTPNTPLPSNIDTNLLNCLNYTIGEAVPLVDGAMGLIAGSPSNVGIVALVWIVWFGTSF